MQSKCPECGSFHIGTCSSGRHRAPSRMRTVVPVLPPPPRHRRRLGSSPTLEMMGFDLPDTPLPALVAVAPPPPPPVHLAPAFTPTRAPKPDRPTPTRPSDRRPTGASPGMQAIVTELWDRESTFFEHAPDLPAPNAPEIERGSKRHLVRYAVVVAAVVTAALGGWLNARSTAIAEVAALEDAARIAIASSSKALDDATGAIADITDPAAVPVALSGAAGVITELSDAALLLREVAVTEAEPGLGYEDPIGDRSAYGAAATAAGALEDAMSSLLTARLLLDELVELPSLSTAPGDASEMSQVLASAISAARDRADRTPAAHPELQTLVHAQLDDLAERAGLYAADLRNGVPVGGHLSALEAQVQTLDGAIEAYVADGVTDLVGLQDAFAAALPRS